MHIKTLLENALYLSSLVSDQSMWGHLRGMWKLIIEYQEFNIQSWIEYIDNIGDGEKIS